MAKKDFSDKANPAINPVMQFLSVPETESADKTDSTQKQKSGAAGKEERKSKRLNLLLQPSVLEDIAKIAYMNQTSVNDLINSTLKALAAAEASTIQKYDTIFNGEIGVE